MLGPLAVGDRVVVNTAGVDLGLGTGGDGFILWNLDGPGPPDPAPGHIVKLRYTPWQQPVLAAEAPESPHHRALVDLDSIDGMPVVACGLHSQVAAVAAGVKAARPQARLGYLMTDGGALPLAWGRLLRALRRLGLVDVTATCGYAFGGDLEAVNVHSGLAVLRAAAEADLVVAGMGPGGVGTATALGFTAMEVGGILDAAAGLGGRGVAALRICFADTRARHAGVSHHSLTALRIAARERAIVALPALPEHRAREVEAALHDGGVTGRHDLVRADGRPGLELLRSSGLEVSSMGKGLEAAPELFLAAAAAGRVAAELL